MDKTPLFNEQQKQQLSKQTPENEIEMETNKFVFIGYNEANKTAVEINKPLNQITNTWFVWLTQRIS